MGRRRAPEGNPKDLPEAPKFAAGWMIPKPDEILYMQDKPFEVPATGVVEYQFFPVDPGWKEDRWISAIEPLPGNPAVVHHILILVVPPGGTLQGLGGDDDFLAAYAPGLRPDRLPAGMARRVKAGSKLVFQMHYTPNGTRRGSQLGGYQVRRSQDGPERGRRVEHDQRRFSDPARCGGSGSPLPLHLQTRFALTGADAAYASPRQGFHVRGRLPQWKARNAPLGAAL